ncbi:response regulator [Parvularcula sp. ZS-1/3]|uniref:Response regulator n=1 Tax=Parvularcula mediterranea TaxID=2732508 RepID=A0A7Y3RNI7_9PROT|nr:response regulator [Parvularcula mediterranea]NNU16841.1 response regulator [Parvularcula mediterranea]
MSSPADFVTTEEITKRRILAIDDEEANLLLLETLLQREGYTDIHFLDDPMKAMDQFIDLEPDLVLLDLMMPDMDGYQLLESFRRHTSPEVFLPVLVLTADTTVQARRRALSLGAKDLVVKPFDVIEVGLRIANLLETQILYERLRS